MIEGVKTKQLKVIPDDRGMLMEILRHNDRDFYNLNFGQLYLSTVRPGVVKAFHMHEYQTDRICCVKGDIKLVLVETCIVPVMKRVYDVDGGPETYEDKEQLVKNIDVLYLGERNPLLVKIPPNVWHGWTPVGDQEAYIINMPDKVYWHEKPDEKRAPYDKWYDWGVKNK